MVLPFISGVHASGSYEIWIRARGAGGYTLERRGMVDVHYPYESTGAGGDFGSSTQTSALHIGDTTPPTTPVVDDGGDTTGSATVLYARWTATDYESGIQEYQYRVGSLSGGPFKELTPWLSAGGRTEMNIRLDTPMEPGVLYYIQVKAKNGAGLWSSEGASDGIQLRDPTPPTQPTIGYVTLGDTLTARWTPAADPESKILGYLFALGSSKGATDVLPWSVTQHTKLSLGQPMLSSLLKGILQKGKTYYFTVRAMNGLGVLGPSDSKGLIAQ
jgi:hypothetical protein